MACDNGEIPSLGLLTFYFESNPISIQPSNYLFLHTYSGQVYCVSGFMGLESVADDTIILGNLIMRQFYTVFDFGSRKIGIAEANRQSSVNSLFVPVDSRNSPIGVSDPALIGGRSKTSERIQISTFDRRLLLISLCSIIIAVIVGIIAYRLQKVYLVRKNQESILSKQ